MPDPIEEPGIHQQGTDLPKGAAQDLDEGLDVANAAPDAPGTSTGTIDESELPEVVGEGGGNEDNADLFGPSDFPNRPLTHGVPIGPGQNFTVTPRMSERAVLTQAAQSIVALKDDVPSDAVLFAIRVLAGE